MSALLRLVVWLLLCAAAAGCAHPYPFVACGPQVRPALGELRDGYAAVRIFYATDRRPTGAVTPELVFGVERTNRLRLGRGEVSIPAGHGKGRQEAPPFLTRARPQEQVMLTSLSLPAAASEPFWSEVRAAVERSERRELLVYIHGYFTTFEGACLDAAQIAHDVELDGPALAYSWTSQAYFWGYLSDTVNVEWTQPYLVRFLESVVERSGARHVFVLAHSMGTRALTRAVREVVRDRALRDEPEFDQVVLAAADDDAELFARDYAPYLARAARRVTIYISRQDWALLGSEKLHGYKRLGQYWPEEMSAADQARIEVVDVSAEDKGWYGHIYYRASPRVLDDLRGIFDGRDAPSRGLRSAGGHFVMDVAPG
ncbi:MAG: alpha/beta hydrolase [Phycisphaerae bacterium]|jgi:esterase/lipase superfamily enzyme